ncbi:MAG: hypothetical protein H6Q89_2817 [Myxococcaceae bacterium]|nr:hypothetical protein [Myxococcaceae bacterium]
MKSSVLSIAVVFAGLAAGNARAQFYTVTSSSQTYVPLTGATVVTLIGGTLPVLDEGSAVIPLGFPFPYYGTTYTSVLVNSNGVLVFGADQAKCDYSIGTTTTRCINGSPGVPTSTMLPPRPHNLIAPWWDDLEGNPGGQIRYTAGTNEITIEYSDWNHYPGPAGSFALQVKLTASGMFQVHYGVANAIVGSGVAAGFEDPTGANGAAFVPCSTNASCTAANWPANTLYTIGVPVQAELGVSSVTLSNVVEGPGALSFTIDPVFRNAGQTAATSFLWRAYLSTNATWDAADTLIFTASAVVSCAAGSTCTASGNASISPPPASGSYYVIVEADPTNVVVEFSETNNYGSTQSPFTQGVDLVATSIASGSAADAGTSIQVNTRWANVGTTDAGAVEARLWLSSDAIFSANDYRLSTYTRFVGGAVTIDEAISVAVPADVPDGLFYWILEVDSAAAVAENSESNNTVASVARVAMRQEPTIASISPTSGPNTGGTLLTITGSNFQPGARLMLGPVTVFNPTITPTTITGIAPARPPGPVDVSVVHPSGASARVDGGYTYVVPPPVVTAITPSQGVVAGGTNVIINGTGFLFGATVNIGGVAATTTSVNSTTISAKTPPGSAGARDVTVTNSTAQSGTLAGGFTYVAAPSLALISPPSGPIAGGTKVTLTGSGFGSGMTVTIGGAPATSLVVVGSTTATVNTPAGVAGARDVVVTAGDGQTATLTGGFTYVPPPTLVSISPARGPAAGGTLVTLTGAGFSSGTAVKFGATNANNLVVASQNAITAIAPAGSAGPVDVVVTNADGQAATLAAGFAYVAPPTLSALTPTSGPSSGGTAITLSGVDFSIGATVKIGTEPASSVVVVDSTTITATTPPGNPGPANVVVTNGDGQSATLTTRFTYLPPPALLSLSPARGAALGGTAITLMGTGFFTGALVKVGGVDATDVIVVSATQLTARTPAGAAGVVEVRVTNPDGQSTSLPAGFTYLGAPSVSRLAPVSGPVEGGTAIIILGDGFASGSTVTIGGAAATDLMVRDTSITAVTPAHAAGTVELVVTNLDGQTATLAAAFTYQAPPDAGGSGATDGGTDGGSGTPQKGGCGCSGTGGAPLLAFALLALTGIRRRRQNLLRR